MKTKTEKHICWVLVWTCIRLYCKTAIKTSLSTTNELCSVYHHVIVRNYAIDHNYNNAVKRRNVSHYVHSTHGWGTKLLTSLQLELYSCNVDYVLLTLAKCLLFMKQLPRNDMDRNKLNLWWQHQKEWKGARIVVTRSEGSMSATEHTSCKYDELGASKFLMAAASSTRKRHTISFLKTRYKLYANVLFFYTFTLCGVCKHRYVHKMGGEGPCMERIRWFKKNVAWSPIWYFALVCAQMTDHHTINRTLTSTYNHGM